MTKEYLITSPDGRKFKVKGDGTREEALAQVRQQEAPMSSMDKFLSGVLGAVEPGITLATGTAALAPAGISEAINPGSYDHVLDAYTYEPRTEAGKAGLENFTQNIGQPVSEFMDKARPAEAAYDATGSETLGAIAGAIPEMVMSALGGLGMPKTPGLPKIKIAETGRIEPTLGKKGEIQRRLTNKVADAETAGHKMERGKVVPHTQEAAALKQGWASNIISMLKSRSKTDNSSFREMVLTAHGISKNKLSAKRVTDAPGRVFMEPIRNLQRVLKTSGKQIEKIAEKNLAGKTVDTAGAFARFEQKIAELKGVISEEGALEFGIGSKMWEQSGSAEFLTTVLKKLEHHRANPDAFGLHEFKQWIYGQVKYAKKSDKGLTDLPEKLAKGLAADINESLKGISKPYDKVNTAYSQARGALDNFQELTGKRVNLVGENADMAVGTKLKNVLKENVNSVPFIDAMTEVVRVSNLYKGNHKFNIKAQMEFAAAAEQMFAAAPENSFVGSIARAASTGPRGISGKVVDNAGGYLINKAMGKNQDAALKTMLELLNTAP